MKKPTKRTRLSMIFLWKVFREMDTSYNENAAIIKFLEKVDDVIKSSRKSPQKTPKK